MMAQRIYKPRPAIPQAVVPDRKKQKGWSATPKAIRLTDSRNAHAKLDQHQRRNSNCSESVEKVLAMTYWHSDSYQPPPCLIHSLPSHRQGGKRIFSNSAR